MEWYDLKQRIADRYDMEELLDLLDYSIEELTEATKEDLLLMYEEGELDVE